MIYALDANVIIHLFQGNGKVMEHFSRIPPERIAIPSIALFDVERAVNTARQRSQLARLAETVAILPLNDAAARIAARLTRTKPIHALIAATALAHNATLVTHNQKEFKRVPGLRTVDWY